MAERREVSSALRRMGRAAATVSDMQLLRAATLGAEQAAASWCAWVGEHAVDDAGDAAVWLLPAVSANVPADVLGAETDRLRGVRRRGWASAGTRLEAASGAIAAITTAGVVPIVTGAAALSSMLPIAAGLRPLGTIDLAVGDLDDKRFEVVLSSLGAAGWKRRRAVDSPFDHVVDLVDSDGHSIRLLRWVLFPWFVDEPEQQWIERAVPDHLNRQPVRRLRWSDELVLTVLDGLLSPGDRTAASQVASVRWPFDVVQLARHAAGLDGRSAAEFWEQVVELANAIGAGPVLSDALEMCRVELDAPVPPAVVTELAAGRLDRHLAQRWALRRRGFVPEWRVRRYRRLCWADGRRPTPWGYARARYDALAARGVHAALGQRVDRAKQRVAAKRSER